MNANVMKGILRFWMLLLICRLSSYSVAQDFPNHLGQELFIDLSSQELETVLQRKKTLGFIFSDEFQPILQAGKRNLEWNTYINSQRTQNSLILHPENSESGIPMSDPLEYSKTGILTNFKSWSQNAPFTMRGIILTGGDLNSLPQIADEIYLRWARNLDREYQLAQRWILLAPFMRQLKAERARDVRGYAFLKTFPDLNKVFANWTSLNTEERTQLKNALIGQCLNSRKSFSACTTELEALLTQRKNPSSFYVKYEDSAFRIWKSFYEIQNSRTDVIWKPQNMNFMTLPFARNATDRATQWIKNSIEQFWQLNEWHLILREVPASSKYIHVDFIPNANAHVDRIGGNKIVLDQNRSLDDPSQSWILAHEFGHTLGFPDCYLEFFDEEKQMIVAYQIHLDNIMCSRAGRMQNVHYDYLKHKYFKN